MTKDHVTFTRDISEVIESANSKLSKRETTLRVYTMQKTLDTRLAIPPKLTIDNCIYWIHSIIQIPFIPNLDYSY